MRVRSSWARRVEDVADPRRAHRDGTAQGSANVNSRGLRSSPFISVGRAGRVVAGPLIFAPRPAPPRWLCRGHSVVRPSPRSHISHIYGGNGDGSTAPQAVSWHHAIALTCPLVAAHAWRRLQWHVARLQSSGTVLAAQHSCVGRWGRISIDQIASVTQHPTLIRSVLGTNPTYWAKCRVFQTTVRKAPFAARRGPSTAEAFKRVGYEVNGLFSFTSFAGESAPRRSSTSSAPLAGLRRGRAVPGRWALDSTRSAVDGVSMRARHAPGLARSVHRSLS